jgi:RsiW-degrading membrane proteinase PrsW (M82 family)
MGLFIPLAAALLPLVVWPIEYYLPYPYLVEEIAKAAVIWLALSSEGLWQKIKLALVVGALFSVSETILYLFNVLPIQGAEKVILQRLTLTLPLHLITSLVIVLPALKDKRLIVFGVILAGLIHYLFNLQIAKL